MSLDSPRLLLGLNSGLPPAFPSPGMTDTAGKVPKVFQQKGERMNFVLVRVLSSPSPPRSINLSSCSRGRLSLEGFLFPFPIQGSRGGWNLGQPIVALSGPGSVSSPARLILSGFSFVRSAGTGGRRGRGRQRIPIAGCWQQVGQKTALFGILVFFIYFFFAAADERNSCRGRGRGW